MSQNETIPGGRYLTANGWVNANGEPLEPPEGVEGIISVEDHTTVVDPGGDVEVVIDEESNETPDVEETEGESEETSDDEETSEEEPEEQPRPRKRRKR